MKFILKGICNPSTILETKNLNLQQYSFDLRPKSFNFTQGYKVKEMIKNCYDSSCISLLFEEEKNYVVKEVSDDIAKGLGPNQELLLEFTGRSTLSELEKYGKNYVWHYQDHEKIKNISNTEFLKRVVFHHSDLEYLNSRGELYGFFNLFSDYFQKVSFEIQLDWNSEIIFSIFENFNLPIVSVEISNLIELSYQNPNSELINTFFNNLELNLRKVKGKK